MAQKPPRIAIIGGGIGGLTLALALALALRRGGLRAHAFGRSGRAAPAFLPGR